jgi:hypothetical protein
VAADVKTLSLVINWKGFEVKGTFTVLGEKNLKSV